MSIQVQLLELSLAALTIICIVTLMIKRKSNESVSIIWILVSLLVAIQGLFPEVLNTICRFLGVDYPPILAVTLGIIGLGSIVFYLSSELSQSQAKIRELAIHISLLNKESVELKERLAAIDEQRKTERAQ